jgi:hypothetical protein
MNIGVINWTLLNLRDSRAALNDYDGDMSNVGFARDDCEEYSRQLSYCEGWSPVCLCYRNTYNFFHGCDMVWQVVDISARTGSERRSSLRHRALSPLPIRVPHQRSLSYLISAYSCFLCLLLLVVLNSFTYRAGYSLILSSECHIDTLQIIGLIAEDQNLRIPVFHLASCPLLFRYVRMGRLRYIRVHGPNQSEARFVIRKLCV